MALPGSVAFHGVSLDYRIFHDRTSSLFEAMANIFNRRTRSERLRALENVNFSISPGESVALVGANGAGKSTALKLLAGIYEPSGGTVGTSGRIASLLDLGVGFHPELTGLENLYLNGALLGLDRRSMAPLIPGIAAFAGLERFLDTPVKFYSSGMFMRLGFSLATSVEPDILLIDEVLSVGDAEFQQRCQDRIYGFRGTGRTIVFVSHDPAAVRRLCDRAIWLGEGRVLMDGPVSSVLAAYAKAPVARHSAVSTSPREWGTRDVRFESVTISDSDDLPAASFRPGQTVRIRASVSTSLPGGVDGLVFGFSVHRSDGERIIGTNNLELNQPLISFRSRAQLVLDVDLETVEPGNYLLGLALTDPARGRDYHWQDYFYPLALAGARMDPPVTLKKAAWTTEEPV